MADGESPLINALRQAVRSAPEQAEFRVALAEALIDAGNARSAVVELGEALRQEPDSARARELMLTALGGGATAKAVPGTVSEAAETAKEKAEENDRNGGFDWSAAEAELGDVAPPPRFTTSASTPTPTSASTPPSPAAAEDEHEDPHDVPAHDVERPALTLADVGGLADVKDRLQAAFLAPMKNPELRRLYGKSLRGGLLLYGPPGCGKTRHCR